MGLFQQPNARAIVMAAPRERSGGAGAIQSSARLLGQSIGAAMVALVFGVSVGSRGAVTALVLAACFAAVATGVSITRQFDFVRAGRPERKPDATKPAEAPGPAA
jgi:DHA2 family multidrug resistance protein-like MFS transporter